MANEKIIVVSSDFEERFFKEIQDMKSMISSIKKPEISDGIKWLDTADLMEYLHISRRTALTLRQKGLLFTQVDGKIFYRKDLVDNFLNQHQIQLKPKRSKKAA